MPSYPQFGYLKGLTTFLLFVVFFFPVMVRAEFIPYEPVNVFSDDILSDQIIDNYVKFSFKQDTIPQSRQDKILGPNIEKTGSNEYKIYSGNQFYNENNKWYQIEYATTTEQLFNEIETKPIPLSLINTANAQVIYSTGNDGYMFKDDNSFAVARSASSATTLTDAGSALYAQVYITGATKRITRTFISFDTSTLDDNICIATTSLFLYGGAISNTDNDGYDYIGIGTSTPADPENLSTADYDQVNLIKNLISDNECDLTADCNNSGYEEFPFNALGTSTIDVEDWVTYSVREGHDIGNHEHQNTGNYWTITGNEYSGTTRDPYLSIGTYTCPEEEEETATSTVSAPCDMDWSTDLSMIHGCAEQWGDSTTTPEKTTYYYFHIPWLVYIIFIILGIWIFTRLLLEFLIRWRVYN